MNYGEAVDGYYNDILREYCEVELGMEWMEWSMIQMVRENTDSFDDEWLLVEFPKIIEQNWKIMDEKY